LGLILDTSILVADERAKFDMPSFLRQAGAMAGQPAIAAITASELLHGVERAADRVRKALRQSHVEQVLASLLVLPFDLAEARCHARIWADLEARGLMIGPHDAQIAATALAQSQDLATINTREFQRVPGLQVFDATPFARR
jgi:tRNA(fMet)-specific endonuclease VapC